MGLRALNNPAASFEDPYASTGTEAYKPGPVPPSLFTVSGGNATETASGYKYFYFTSPGNLTVRTDAGPGGLEMSFMMVGGGGGATDTGSGGGGGGAFVQKVDFPVLGVPTINVNWAVSVGEGGAYPAGPTNPSDSTTFTLSTIPKVFTATGGGAGQATDGLATGGSGGGGGRNPPSGSTGGEAAVPQTIDGDGNTPDAGIGYDGGNGFQNMPGPEGGTGGGGGGAGGVGANSPTTTSNPYGQAGKGGLGRAAFLGDANIPTSYGTSGPTAGRWFAGGGGGGNHTENSPTTQLGGAAPDGGGGATGSSTAPPTTYNGTPVVANTGGGGGGGGGASQAYVGEGSAGADGICIVKISTDLLS